jgi:hypothetical protein
MALPQRGSIIRGLLVVSLATSGLPTQPLSAQEAPDTAEAPAPGTSILPQPPISPRSAFLRSIALPGWGHASLGSYGRGAFYFGAQTATLWMLLTVGQRVNAAENARDLRIEEVESRARAEGVTDPFEIQARVDADPSVSEAQGLVDARSQQFEDWLALGIFMVLLGGADAYVSAHLSGFPAPVDIDSRMRGSDRVEIGISIPVGPPGRR